MLPRIAYISPESLDGDRRTASRRTVFLPATSSPIPWGSRAILLDLSETGLRLQCHAPPQVGETIAVELPIAGEVAARVVWRRLAECGAQFDQPIPRAAVSAAVLSSPTPQQRAATESRTVSSSPPAERPLSATWALFILMPVVLLLLFAFAFLPVSGW